jgi:hypothetical protein
MEVKKMFCPARNGRERPVRRVARASGALDAPVEALQLRDFLFSALIFLRSFRFGLTRLDSFIARRILA